MKHSAVKKSECAKYDFGHFLFAPEFFLPDKLVSWEKLNKKASKLVSDYFLHVRDTTTTINESSICYDLTDGLPKFLDGGVEIDSIKSMKKIGKQGDFVISRLRSYLEEMAIVEKRTEQQLFSSEFLIFRNKNNDISTYTLFALCMTKIVQIILKRGQYGTGHPRFYDFLLTELPVPDYLLSIDKHIKEIMQQALRVRLNSRKFYNQAQDILLSELGLTNWQSEHQLTFTKCYSDIKKSGRKDAEYFQPKYEKIINAIKKYSGGWDTLGNITIINGEDYKPQNDKQYKYIELSNVGESGEIMGCMIKEGIDLPSRARRKITADDVIVSSIEGSLSSIAIIESEYNQALCSTGFYIINSKFLNSATLLILLKSIIGQLQLKKGCNGTILTAINNSEFNKIILPKIKKTTQTKIRQKITESSALRKQSEHLLECAKKTVEIAIEKDKKAALAWLKRATKE